MSSCTKHHHEHAMAACRRCADEWCAACLVFTYGPDKPPYCVSCAMVAAGVRSTGRPAASRRQLKAQRKAEKQAQKQAAKAARTQPSAAETENPAGGVEAGGTTTTEGTDWSDPWWERSDERVATG